MRNSKSSYSYFISPIQGRAAMRSSNRQSTGELCDKGSDLARIGKGVTLER